MADEGFKRKLAAILSADVIGYSRLMRDDEEATVRDIAAHRVLISDIIQQHHGRVVDSPGDNILAEFASVVDAVNGAIRIQHEIKKRNADTAEDRRMEFRIGINLGDVIEEQERLYGDGVNIAARVEGLAAAGGISISGTVYEHIKDKLTLGYHYLGEQDVKNIPEPVRVYRLLTEPQNAGKLTGTEKTISKRGWLWAVSAAVVVSIVALVVWQFYMRRPSVEPASVEKMVYPLPDKPSIVVLAFDNMSGDPEQEYFSDGLSEEIITALSKSSQIFVIARNSSFTYKGKPVKIQQVAEDLGVRYVLEGSVRKDTDRVRITAQLIDAVKGIHLWAERYDRELKDIFAIQDDITKQIITALHVKLSIGEDAQLIARTTNSLDAYSKYLVAREYHYKFTKEDNLNARRLLEEIITIDPEYGSAYSLLGGTHMLDVFLQATDSPKKSLGRAIELQHKAITLGTNAHHVLGFLYLTVGKHDQAFIECKQAVELNPNSATARTFYGIVLGRVGRFEEAVYELEQGLRLDPFASSFTLRSLALAYSNAGRSEDAISICKKATQKAPNDLIARIVCIQAYSSAGKNKEAENEAAEVLRINPKFYLKSYKKRAAYKNKADTDRMITMLRKAGLPYEPPLPLPDKPSIAVLPFVNMSGDQEQEYFSNGISEEIITALSKTPKLFVIARTSAFRYKGKEVDIRTIGRELGVHYVLEGSVRKAGSNVRITAQLIDAKTNKHIWAERYDREVKDTFALQDEITMKILTALELNLSEGEQAVMVAKGTRNLDAYLKVLQSTFYRRRLNVEDNVKARRLAKEAISLDPDYAIAYTTLGRTHVVDVWLRATKSLQESTRLAIDLAEKALSLDESLADAYDIIGNSLILRREYEKAIAKLEQALKLEPNGADIHGHLGMALVFDDRPQEAVQVFQTAVRLNPTPPELVFAHVGYLL